MLVWGNPNDQLPRSYVLFMYGLKSFATLIRNTFLCWNSWLVFSAISYFIDSCSSSNCQRQIITMKERKNTCLWQLHTNFEIIRMVVIWTGPIIIVLFLNHHRYRSKDLKCKQSPYVHTNMRYNIITNKQFRKRWRIYLIFREIKESS